MPRNPLLQSSERQPRRKKEPNMSTIPGRHVRGGRRLLLHDVDWRTYSRLLRTFAERRSVRLTYDRGDLEIMSPLYEHEADGRFLGRLAVVLTEELGRPV